MSNVGVVQVWQEKIATSGIKQEFHLEFDGRLGCAHEDAELLNGIAISAILHRHKKLAVPRPMRKLLTRLLQLFGLCGLCISLAGCPPLDACQDEPDGRATYLSLDDAITAIKHGRNNVECSDAVGLAKAQGESATRQLFAMAIGDDHQARSLALGVLAGLAPLPERMSQRLMTLYWQVRDNDDRNSLVVMAARQASPESMPVLADALDHPEWQQGLLYADDVVQVQRQPSQSDQPFNAADYSFKNPVLARWIFDMGDSAAPSLIVSLQRYVQAAPPPSPPRSWFQRWFHNPPPAPPAPPTHPPALEILAALGSAQAMDAVAAYSAQQDEAHQLELVQWLLDEPDTGGYFLSDLSKGDPDERSTLAGNMAKMAAAERAGYQREIDRLFKAPTFVLAQRLARTQLLPRLDQEVQADDQNTGQITDEPKRMENIARLTTLAPDMVGQIMLRELGSGNPVMSAVACEEIATNYMHGPAMGRYPFSSADVQTLLSRLVDRNFNPIPSGVPSAANDLYCRDSPNSYLKVKDPGSDLPAAGMSYLPSAHETEIKAR